MSSPARADAVIVSRQLLASRDRVFDWLTDPDKLARWMSPQGDVIAQADAKPGGRLVIVMTDGPMRIEHHGEYLVVERPARLVFTWNSPYTDGDSLITIDLVALGDRTGLTLRHERLPQQAAESHGRGWEAILERLATELGREEL